MPDIKLPVLHYDVRIIAGTLEAYTAQTKNGLGGST